MASVKFKKDSKEWQMFANFWNICQKYWIIENGDDKYWESVIEDVKKFSDNYNDITLSRKLALAFLDDLESRSKNK